MLKNYIKIAWRTIWKTKGYSFLNIFGLGLGIACAALIFLWVEHETTFDSHFANRETIYEVKSKQTYGSDIYVFSATPGKLGAAIEAEFPEAKAAARTTWDEKKLVTLGDKNIYESGMYADPQFADMFSLEMIEGNAKDLLTDHQSIVISSAMARRFFGDKPAIGQILQVDHQENYRVAGVMADQPSNSSIRFDWLLPFSNYEKANPGLQIWGNNSARTFVQLHDSKSLATADKKLDDFVERKTNGEVTFSRNFLYPMERWHLYNSFRSGYEVEGAIKQVRLFSVIAWIILLIACINFMNLATARSEKRAKEVGVRKVVGAERPALIRQFIGEALIMAVCAAIVALVMVYLSITPFNNLIGAELSVNISSPIHLAFLFSVILICGLVAGSYPALYLSSFNPLAVIKGLKLKTGSAPTIRRVLVIVQFAASITLIICTAMIYQQIQYVKNRDLGFDKDLVINTVIQGDIPKHLDLVKRQLIESGMVENSATSYLHMLKIYSNTSGISWEGKDPNLEALISFNQIDEHLIPTLNLQLAAGRNFHPDLLGDSSSVIINEAFAKIIDQDMDVIGKTLQWNNAPATIVGVLKNFVFNSVYTTRPEPLIMAAGTNNDGQLYMKIPKGAPLTEAIETISGIIRQQNPGYPFEYHFLDQDIEAKFNSAKFTQKLSGLFAALSIGISCLGLFGLASFMAERRKKEVSIRKVLGASLSSLTNLLSKEFVVLVLISCLIAFPVAYWAMSDWLKNYDYRIDIQWSIFLLAGVSALFIALATVSSQAIKVAVRNPAKTLREE